MKHAKKVALINVFDYPRNHYGAYWQIAEPKGDDATGWRWSAQLHSYDPTRWTWHGTATTDRPGVPLPSVTPEIARDVSSYRALVTRMLAAAKAAAAAGELYSLFAPDVPVTQARYTTLTSAEQAEVRDLQDARRDLAVIVTGMHPLPVTLIEEAVDVAATRDDADTAAQQWVLARIENHRRAAPLREVTDADIEAMIAAFDAARARKDFGLVDKLRGELKAAGAEFDEPSSIADPAPTKWQRKQSGYALGMGPLGLIAEGIRELLQRAFDIVLLASGYNVTVRNSRLNAVRDAIDAGAGAGLWRIYDGSRPATCGTATTLLAELTFSDPCAAAASSGVLTHSAITADASANATGTATWSRKVDSTGTCVEDGSVGTSGSDLNVNSTAFSTGLQVSITSATITEGNP